MAWFNWFGKSDIEDSGKNQSLRIHHEMGGDEIEVLRIGLNKVEQVQDDQGLESNSEALNWIAKLFGFSPDE